MKLPTKEELKKERLSFFPEEEWGTIVWGGEVDGIIEFAQNITRLGGGISKADETFINYLIYSQYPYELDDLIDAYENFVMRDDRISIWDSETKSMRYIKKYSDSQIKSMALAWFDRRIGKLIRIGALNCSMNTNYFNTLKQGFRFSNLVGIIKQRLIESGEVELKTPVHLTQGVKE
jgi:hypothetical protein